MRKVNQGLKPFLLTCSAIFGAFLFSCATQLVADPSAPAMASNDLTLGLQACDGPVSAGFGVCWVTAGDPVAGVWRVILPSKGLVGGQLTIKASGVAPRSFPITSTVLEIPLTDLFGTGAWKENTSTLLAAQATVSAKDPTGIVRTVIFEGMVLVRVLAQGYSRMPINSGYQTWGTDCKVQYSSSGRSAVACQ